MRSAIETCVSGGEGRRLGVLFAHRDKGLLTPWKWCGPYVMMPSSATLPGEGTTVLQDDDGELRAIGRMRRVHQQHVAQCEVLNGTVGGPRQQTTGRGPGREDKQQKLLRYTVRSKPLSALRFPASVTNVTKHGARAYPLRATPTTANSAHRSR